MNIKLTDIKIPGVLWVLLIGVAVVLAENYAAQPELVQAGIVALFAIAKYVNVGTSDVEHLLDLLRQINNAMPTRRGGGSRAIDKEIEGATPNKTVRWLVG